MNLQRIMKNFDRAAPHYDKASFVQKKILAKLIDYLNELAIQPKRILDLGCGTGDATYALAELFPEVSVTYCDLSKNMLSIARNKSLNQNSDQYVNADMQSLPFKPKSFDLVFSSLAFQWGIDLKTLFSEIKLCLADDGRLVFSSLGTETMKEIKNAWNKETKNDGLHNFKTLSDYKNALVEAGFLNISIQKSVQTEFFDSVDKAVRSIRDVGALNVNDQRTKVITTKNKWQTFVKNYEAFRNKGKIPVTYDVFYGAAIKK